MEQNQIYLNKAITENSKVNLIKYFSIEIWNRLGFIYNQNKYLSKKAKYGEVTITQTLIYEILKINFETGNNLIRIEESLNEKSNGADILVEREFSNGYLSFPFQAKLLTTHKKGKNGTYKHFVHSNSRGENQQIDLLISSAENEFESHLAFYLLYNYLEDYTKSALSETKKSYYGMSFCSANYIREKLDFKNFQFSELHPNIGKAFYRFFLDNDDDNNDNGSNSDNPDNHSSYSDIINFFKRFEKDIDEEFIINKLHFKSAEDVFNDKSWNPMESNSVKSFNSNKISNDNDYFRPKYRIILSPQSTKNVDEISLGEILSGDGGSAKEIPTGDTSPKPNEVLLEELDAVIEC